MTHARYLECINLINKDGVLSNASDVNEFSHAAFRATMISDIRQAALRGLTNISGPAPHINEALINELKEKGYKVTKFEGSSVINISWENS